MKNVILLAVALATFDVAPTLAEVTLTYELTNTDNGKSVKQFSIKEFYARIDDPADKNKYLLFQAGKFFPLFEVNQSEKIYTRLTPAATPTLGPSSPPKQAAKTSEPHNKATTDTGPADGTQGQPETGKHPGPAPSEASAKTPAPRLKPTKKSRKVADIECRIVLELQEGKPVIEHCMANSARLGITKREVITLSRTFNMGRDEQFDWLATGTKDEEFISIESKDLRSNRMLRLVALSTKPRPAGYYQIAREYRQVAHDSQLE
jgi:hypothetical protein